MHQWMKRREKVSGDIRDEKIEIRSINDERKVGEVMVEDKEPELRLETVNEIEKRIDRLGTQRHYSLLERYEEKYGEKLEPPEITEGMEIEYEMDDVKVTEDKVAEEMEGEKSVSVDSSKKVDVRKEKEIGKGVIDKDKKRFKISPRPPVKPETRPYVSQREKIITAKGVINCMASFKCLPLVTLAKKFTRSRAVYILIPIDIFIYLALLITVKWWLFPILYLMRRRVAKKTKEPKPTPAEM